MTKYQNIPLEDWDNLIVLDACRFDFFKKVYKDYLDGKLEKRISKGSCTGEWLEKTFPNKYDYTYISSNPFINSYGMPLNKCHPAYENYLWNAVDHFSHIVDVWEFGYSPKYDAVHPREVNIAYLKNITDKKTIIHYMQPHQPFLSYKGKNRNSNSVKLLKDVFLKHIPKEILTLFKIPIWTTIEQFYRLFNKNHQMTVKTIMCEEFGVENLHYYYEENLRIALLAVSKLVNELDGITIITSDHGEAFGEQGKWEHPLMTHIPVLIEVPWLIIKKLTN